MRHDSRTGELYPVQVSQNRALLTNGADIFFPSGEQHWRIKGYLEEHGISLVGNIVGVKVQETEHKHIYQNLELEFRSPQLRGAFDLFQKLIKLRFPGIELDNIKNYMVLNVSS